MRHFPASALVTALLLALAGSAGAAPLAFTGFMEFRPEGAQLDTLEGNTRRRIYGGGVAQVSVAGSSQLLSFSLPSGAFTTPYKNNHLVNITNPLGFVIEDFANRSGLFTGFASGPPRGGGMGVEGTARYCLIFDPACEFIFFPVPISQTASGGFGVGGTRTTLLFSGPTVVTAQHAPWTVGSPGVVLHDVLSNSTTPQGFIHGPASNTSTAGQAGGVVQLVTITQVIVPGAGGLDQPLAGVLRIEFIPEPGPILLLAFGAVALAWARLAPRR
jgi:hypothetical protein